jgi:hypothetical protein
MRLWKVGIGLLLWAPLTIGAVIHAGAESPPEVSIAYEVGRDLSPACAILPRSRRPNPGPPPPAAVLPLGRLPLPNAQPTDDPVVQRETNIPFGATIGLNFVGIGIGMPGFQPLYYPPDTTGAVGATQYVQWVNTSEAVFDKGTGNLVLGPFPGNALWLGFGGGCNLQNDGDPVVEYDKQAGRWMLSQFTSNPPFLECIAVSQTSDATGPYYRYAFTMGPNFADYPRASVWPDAYYFSFNIFNPTTNNLIGGRACAFDRGTMLSGQPAVQICFDSANTFGTVPSDWDGAMAPPTGSPNYFVQMGNNSLNVYSFHFDSVTPTNATFTGPVNLPVAPFTPACGVAGPIGDIAADAVQRQPGCIPQMDTPLRLDELADRLMYRAAYRNFGDHEALVVLHTVARTLLRGKPVGAALRWYELRGLTTTPIIFQQGTYAPNAQWRWMGSAGMDATGDIAIGYSTSGPLVFPGIRATGRTPADPVNTLETETIIFHGKAPQLGTLKNLAGGGATIALCRSIRSTIAPSGTPMNMSRGDRSNPIGALVLRRLNSPAALHLDLYAMRI